MDRLNLFNPFDSLPMHYENRLTWAFLVVLKCDPSLQSFLRELVESRLPLEYREYSNSWDPARISTQTKWIESTTNRLVSVLLTDECIKKGIRVEWSDRDPVYDGVIEYPNGLTLFVENKPFHGDVREEQLSPSRKWFRGDIDDVKLHSSAICLEWSEVLEGLLKYADSSIAPFSSHEVIRDFLSFVEEEHPELTIYRTFKLCGEISEALQRRTSRLLDNLAKKVEKEDVESRDGYLFRPGKIAERVMIQVEAQKLKMGLAPGDTVGQARHFYKAVDKAAFLSMREWKVKPNLHFSFASRHLIWAETTCETREYFDRFSDESLYGKKSRDELLCLAKQWEREHLISSEDRRRIEAEFNNTTRQSLNVVPGFSVTREWEFNTVIDLEERKKLEECIINAVATPLATWRETL